ncbi:class I SAM-dependent methyltransferase [Paraburkholderia ferrariae]|uniref:Class I SAM-dependent methyltransferase n=1 Tax=Paraburkholderia ferrariae TaxID=386056 RepID=A0ABU9RTY2_9BURK
MSIRQAARSIALRVPAVERVVSHRDQLLQDASSLHSRLAAVEAQRDSLSGRLAECQAELQEAQKRLARTGEQSVLDAYVTEPPGRERAFRIFEGSWASEIPGYGFGAAKGLFDDPRIKWWGQQCGGLQGKRVLELGPLEGGHTSMMSKAGAASITAIESNTKAFLKCLIVQNTFKFNADFILGDFRPYLEICTETFDFLCASGVLYHMTEPVKLLQDMAKVSRSIGIWTHYYDPDVILNTEYLARKFDEQPRRERIGSRDVVSYKQSYLEALNWSGFCGGNVPISYWLTRDSLIGVIEDLGFKVEIGSDEKKHPHGPCMTLFASRR